MHKTCGVLWIIGFHRDIALDTRQRDMSFIFGLHFLVYKLVCAMVCRISILYMREASSRKVVAIVIVGLGYHRSLKSPVPVRSPPITQHARAVHKRGRN